MVFFTIDILDSKIQKNEIVTLTIRQPKVFKYLYLITLWKVAYFSIDFNYPKDRLKVVVHSRVETLQKSYD